MSERLMAALEPLATTACTALLLRASIKEGDLSAAALAGALRRMAADLIAAAEAAEAAGDP